MLILAMAVFGTGIYFAFKIFGDVQNTGNVLDQQTKDLMEKKLRDSSQLVAFGTFQQTVQRGDNIKFALGIANTDETEATYTIAVTCSFATDKNGDEITTINTNTDCPITKPQPIIIKAHDYGVQGLFFHINNNAKIAKYSYDVIVTSNGQTYGGLQKLYINVK